MSKKEYKLENNLIDVYFQKSIKFLYPLLDISSKYQIFPTQTYLGWVGLYSPYQFKLLCEYKLAEDTKFKQFEKTMLIDNKFFEDFKKIEGDKGIFVFDLSSYKDDVTNFYKGRYSKFLPQTKTKILNFNSNAATKEYINSYLNPMDFVEHYATLLKVQPELLITVGELCDPFNEVKETLKEKAVDVIIFNSIVHPHATG